MRPGRRSGTRPRKLGTFLGVFTPSILTILGVILYLRTGWVVGNVGLAGAIAIVVICSYAVAANQERIAVVGGWVIAMVVLINALGYLAGWLLARLYGFDANHRLTLAIEIGMQNAGLGVALALKHFAPETALPGALFAFWCILTAAGASSWLRKRGSVPAPV